MFVYLANVPCTTIIICMYLFSRVACNFCKPEILEINLLTCKLDNINL